MINHAILAALILFSCDASDHASVPDDEPPKEQGKQELEAPKNTKQHFCCESLSGNGSGDGCAAISKEFLNTCKKVLYCAESWEDNDGHVTCL